MMSRRESVMAWLLLALSLASGGCELPRDPEGTLRRVRGGALRVGVIHAPPWADTTGEEPRGVEVKLVRRLAGELGAEAYWTSGREDELLHALEHFQLDLVIGGLTRRAPWKDRAALTLTHTTSDISLAIAPGQPCPATPEGQQVAIRGGDVLAATLAREQGALPRGADHPFAQGLPVITEGWRIRERGWKACGKALKTDEHVLAAPPGENAWLLYLDDLVHRERQRLAAWLAGEEGP